jgi:hypothetical protein
LSALEHFNYRATIGQMVKNNRLAPILTKGQRRQKVQRVDGK